MKEGKGMNVLVACEWSGEVRDAFRAKGHNAWSCDLIPTVDRGTEHWRRYGQYHYITDVLNLIKYGKEWDMMIAFPPCDHLAVSGARWFEEKRKDGRQQAAIEFFRELANAPIPRIAIENPVGIMSTVWRKPDQIIQPWQFGHGETKATCLWLKGLPKLQPTCVVEGREHRVWRLPPSEDRAKLRGRTYRGIAEAMAEQWGSLKEEHGT